MASLATGDGLRETVLVVPAMHCAGCMGKVERALGAVGGVQRARANLTARQVVVRHDGAAEAGLVAALVEALAQAGFAAQPRAQELALPASAVRPLLAPMGVAGFACMNVMLLSVSVWSGAGGATRDLFHLLSAVIAVPAIAYSGRVFFASGWGAVRRGRTNMDVPISIGVLLATGLSLYESLTHGQEAWFDGTLMLLLFLLGGRVLDAMMRDRARAGVDSLLRQAASGAMVVGNNGTGWVAAHDLVPGMVMRVAAGERLAADGVVLGAPESGVLAQFDASLLTGESAPVPVAAGAQLLAGMLNLDRPVDVRVSAVGGQTSLAEMARLMEAAGQHRGSFVRIADRASRAYAPLVHSLAALAFAGWMLAGAGVYASLKIAIAVLIITCPCALGLAVPVAQVVACGALMRRGIMAKDGGALERMAQVDRALLDKTGTLTLGRPVPDAADLAALGAQEKAVALALASHSAHPLSRALAGGLAGVAPEPLESVEEQAGAGVFARWRGRSVALRRPEAERDGAGGMAVELDMGDAAWRIGFADALRPDWRAALDWLGRLGVEPQIVSGDNAQAVAQVAQTTGLAARAGASPADKLAVIAQVQANGAHQVLMVGDGLNDALALAGAHASMAPGSASDVGRQAADCVFMGESLLAVPRMVAMARRTQSVVKQNFALAIGYNLLAVPLAMAGMVTPLVAAVAMSTSSLVVIFNSLRLGFGAGMKAPRA